MTDFVVNYVKNKVKSYQFLYQKRFPLEFFIFHFAITMGPLIMSRHPTQSNQSNHHKVSFSFPSLLHQFIIEVLNFEVYVYVAIATQILATNFLLKVTWYMHNLVILASLNCHFI